MPGPRCAILMMLHVVFEEPGIGQQFGILSDRSRLWTEVASSRLISHSITRRLRASGMYSLAGIEVPFLMADATRLSVGFVGLAGRQTCEAPPSANNSAPFM